MTKGRHEAVLGEIQRLFGVANKAAYQTKNRGLMAVHYLGECRLPTTQGQCRKFAVRARLEVQAHRTSSVSAWTTAWSKVLA